MTPVIKIGIDCLPSVNHGFAKPREMHNWPQKYPYICINFDPLNIRWHFMIFLSPKDHEIEVLNFPTNM